jgi:RHS repeat-associated protein
MGCKLDLLPMLPASMTLSSSTPSHFVSSDGRLTVDVPAGAISAGQLALDGGRVSLLVRQILPGSGGNAGGSGQFSFGTYLLQVVTANGQLASHGLGQPVGLSLHYGSGDSALNLAKAFVVLNESIPPCVNLDPASVVIPGSTATPSPTTQPTASTARQNSPSSPRLSTNPSASSTLRASVGRWSSKTPSLSPSSGTLTTSAPLSSPTTSLSWGTTSTVATFGKPQPFEANLSGGSLTASYPIDLPAGPKGLKPPLSLNYNSAGVSDQHNPQGPAPWVGEGWNVTLGAISWSEHYVSEGGSAHWQDSWELSDPYGTSATLIPPATNTATYFEDSGNPITASPVQWHTDPETYVKVFSYVGPFVPNGASTPMPCFRVLLKNGVIEEFGCTYNSVQWYPSGSTDYIAAWNLDLIIEPDGNQIQVSYQSDREGGANYPVDTVLYQIQWDSPSCSNASTACTTTGAAPNLWAPLMQVTFNANNQVQRGPGSSCPHNYNWRCDNPIDLSPSGLAAPTLMSDFVLNDILVQVKNSTTWNTLRDYQFSYDQTPPTTVQDPVTGKQESTAGKLVLTQMTVVGDDSTTTAPNIVFGYVKQIEYYEDSLLRPTPNTWCGPTSSTDKTVIGDWNIGTCLLWSQSYDGNSYYMYSANNGIGLQQIFVWQNLRDNMHGVYNGGNPTDPYYCTNQQVYGGGSTFPCNMPDDATWSRVSLQQSIDSLGRLSQAGQGGTQTTTWLTGTTTYRYRIQYPLAAQQCSTCVAGYSWGDQYDQDYLDFYNGKFMGFFEANVTKPDGSLDVHNFYATEGWGGWDSNGYGGLTIPCPHSPPNNCHYDAYFDVADQRVYGGQANALHGHEYALARYDVNGTRLETVVTQYYNACTPVWIANGSPPVSGYGTWWGSLVAPLDLANPVSPCDAQVTQVDDKIFDGSTSSSVPDQTTTYTYETGNRPCPTCYGRVNQVTTTSNDGSANGNPTSITKTTYYVWNDSATTGSGHVTSTSAAGPYLISFPDFAATQDITHNWVQCTYNGYDQGVVGATGQTSSLVGGDLTGQTRYTDCLHLNGPITTTYGFSNGIYPNGNPWWSNDADANAGNSAHVGCTINAAAHSTCTTFDSYFAALPTQQANALNQASTSTYQAPASANGSGGFGLWPISSTDANGQITSYTYDRLGRQTSVTLPLETTGLSTQTMAYTVWCVTNGTPPSPCAEIDSTQRLNSTTTITNRAFYDGMGHLIETRSPAPGTQDIVQYYYFDPSQRVVFKSVPYFVLAYSGSPGAPAYSIPDSTIAGTSYTYDGIDRTTSVKDPLSHTTSTAYSVVCNAPGTGDAACYEQVMTVDPLNHLAGVLTDALGRINYEQRYTGNSTYSVYATTKYTYDYLGELTQILHPDGTTKTTYQYDLVGRQTGMTDPDRGTESYVYDQNGNLIQSTDARGSAGTVYIGYDGVDRPVWRNTTNTPTGAYDTYSYDSTANGNVGVGRLTNETFAAPSGMSGSYGYVYDGRGQVSPATLMIGSTSYPLRSTYDDAGSVLTQTYPDGETVTNSYGSQDWLSGVSTSQGSTSLLSGAAYTGTGGATGFITGASLGGGTYQYSAAFDLLARATDINVKRTSGQVTMFDQARTFDAAGNVSTANTTLSTGTDNQAFCYDEQNRLTAAASSGSVSCQTFTVGTLTSAAYNQSSSYDTMGRLASGPLGAYTYGSSAHVHGATAIGSTYTAAYDASGDMTCRAPSASITCNGTQTGAQLAYNNEGQLANWQNQPSSPTSTAAFLYDGQGNRVAQQATAAGSTTTTVYVGGVEEDATTGSTTNKTTYYYANAQRFAMAVNGSFSYLASDGLGSANVVLNSTGNVTGSVLYAPYGSVRYTSGTMLTDHGFTGQIADSTNGLDYYGARYYDPVAGQFTSADTVVPGGGFDVWGLSRYGYVEGNPINRTDPSGNCASDSCYAAADYNHVDTSTSADTVSFQQHHSAVPAPLKQTSKNWWNQALDWAGQHKAAIIAAAVVVVAVVAVAACVATVACGLALAGAATAAYEAAFAACVTACVAIGGVGSLIAGVVSGDPTVPLAPAGLRGPAAEAGGDLAPAVIGENMARVRAAATDIGGVTYRATPGLSEADLMAENEAQIAAWKAEGRQIMDIGPAPNSPNHPNFPEISSPYYRMERAATDGYSGYAQLWIQEEGGLWP